MPLVQLLFYSEGAMYSFTRYFIELDETELGQLDDELETYNVHITELLKGTLPNDCYRDIKDKEMFFIQYLYNKEYLRTSKLPKCYSFLARRDNFLEYHPFFKAVVKNFELTKNYKNIEEYEEEDEEEWIKDLSDREIIGTFVTKYWTGDWEGCVYPIYHSILPITKKMLLKVCSEKSFEETEEAFEYESYEDSDFEDSETTDTKGISKIAYLEKLLTDKYLTEDKKKTIREILEAKKIEKSTS